MKSNTLPTDITIIAAVASDGSIGRKGELLFRISEDLKRFKALTMGQPIIMGRKTFESLPGALPGRKNIVITHNPDFNAPGATVSTSLEQALTAAGPQAKPFVIGGGEIYKQAMRYATRLELTQVQEPGPRDADTSFPTVDPTLWEQINSTPLYKDEKSGVKYKFVTYSRKKLKFAEK